MSAPESLSGVLLAAAETYVRQSDWESAQRCLEELRGVVSSDDDTPAAQRAWRLEGDVARGRGDLDGAEQAWLRCRDAQLAAGDEEGAADTLRHIAEVQIQAGHLSEADTSLRACLRLAPDPIPPRAHAMESLGSVHRLRADFREAIEAYNDALEIWTSLGDEEGEARVRTGLGNTYYRMGEYERAVENHQRSLEHFERRRDNRGITKCVNNLGTVLLQTGDYEGARENFERAHELATALGDTRILSNVVSNLGLICLYEGHAAQAQEYYVESLKLREANKDLPGQAISLNNLANVALMAGRSHECVALSTRSIEIRDTLGLHGGKFRPWYSLAQAHLDLNQLEEAEHAAREIRRLSDDSNEIEAGIQADLVLASIALRREDPETALTHAEAAAAASKRSGYRRGHGDALQLRGESHLRAGDLDRARSLLLECEATFRDLSSPFYLASCQLLLGQLFLRVGSPEASAARLRQAAEIFRRHENYPRQWHCLISLAEAEWPLSHRQARVTVAAAADLATQIGRDDLRRRTATLIDELEVRASSAIGTGADAGPLLVLSAALRESEDTVSTIEAALRVLVDQFDLRHALADMQPSHLGQVGPYPTESTVGEESERLIGEAQARQQPRFRWHSGTDENGWYTIALPITGIRTTPMGTLIVSGTEEGGSAVPAHRAPQAVPALEIAAYLLGLALQASGRTTTRIEPVASVNDGEVVTTHGIVGGSPAIREVLSTIERVAPADASVLIQGESGTGKELAAKAIHKLSARADQPFITINCPTFPRELIESELFGHEKGAFTDAHVAKPGQVELADGGTLFLDEIGDMDIAMQSKLLRFLQEREFMRVGGRKTLRVDVRLLAATSRDFEAEIREGRFREDLFYRINVVPLRMPPLRSRVEDIPMLARFFFEKMGEEPKTLNADVLDLFQAYRWPGNVRELENLVEYGATMASGDVVTLDDLPAKVRQQPVTKIGRSSQNGDAPLRSGETLEARLMTVEGSLIRWALESASWNQSAAAKVLGITETKIRNRMKRYGLERPVARDSA